MFGVSNGVKDLFPRPTAAYQARGAQQGKVMAHGGLRLLEAVAEGGNGEFARFDKQR